MMQPKILQLKEKKLVGQQLQMSLTNNLTQVLWSTFMPRRKEIQNRLGTDFISLQIYPTNYHVVFDPNRKFQKWATVVVSDFSAIPEGMETLTLNAGLYAVFHYKGAAADPSIYEYIYSKWMPNSEYQLDNRPHFEVLGANYKNNDPNSEEEIWIPIKI